jgi:hypothetical protein
MAEILGAEMPQFSFGSGIGNINWMVIAIILLVLVAGSIIIFLVYQRKIYNKKIIVFENVSGAGFQPVLRDRARLIRVGSQGEEVLYLKKKKVYRTAYGRKMGSNTYWFAVGQDGYWYNIILGDLDAKMGMLDIEPVDRDMRYLHVALGRNIDKRYEKQKFMEKYGTVVMNGFFLLIMLIGLGILINKISDIVGALPQVIDATKGVIDSANSVVASMDNVCTAGGGSLIPVAN